MSDTDPNSKVNENAEPLAENAPAPSDEISEASLNEISGGIKVQKVDLVENPDGTVSYKATGWLRSRPSKT